MRELTLKTRQAASGLYKMMAMIMPRRRWISPGLVTIESLLNTIWTNEGEVKWRELVGGQLTMKRGGMRVSMWPLQQTTTQVKRVADAFASRSTSILRDSQCVSQQRRHIGQAIQDLLILF
jgi:hypothetical protein